jgi:hypothetical protein
MALPPPVWCTTARRRATGCGVRCRPMQARDQLPRWRSKPYAAPTAAERPVLIACQVVNLCEGEVCRRRVILAHFGETLPPTPPSAACCDVCANAGTVRAALAAMRRTDLSRCDSHLHRSSLADGLVGGRVIR